ncbi:MULTISPECIES: phosphatase [Clostridium]|uniref:phosphatase n=1 Tax=Clostridium TaxID=1485 RepID=UPI000983D0FA|nr:MULTISPECIES: phosphatase [Clostridium]AQR97447.1 putative phosphatase YcdX [Clostridium saccharoperbutylacetonicum]NSB33331.1 putative hydrolase [Clostridium saccharoperbutylacetonicum]
MIVELDVHTHTIASGHAYSTIREMMKAASKKGLKLLGITEHARGIPGTCSDIYFENLKVVPREMYGVELMLGAEINILDYDGSLSLEDRIIDKLDIRIAGIHNHCYIPGTIEQNTNAVVQVIKKYKIDIISHPDDGSCPLDYDTIVRASKKYNTLLELNNNSINPINCRKNARENNIDMLKLCKKYNVQIILSSDAHIDTDISRFDFSYEILNEADFPEKLVINNSVTDFKNKIKMNRIQN